MRTFAIILLLSVVSCAGCGMSIMNSSAMTVRMQDENANEVNSNTNEFTQIVENPFLGTSQNPLSTFSIDVDTASYSIIRQFLNDGKLPPKDAIRIEEMVNYFDYQYPQPKGDDPFSINVEVATCPWQKKHSLARIGIKGREIKLDKRPPCNLVFLIDVSGSMDEPNRLPLVKQALSLMVAGMREEDRIAIVVYAGSSGLVLPSTSGEHKSEILSALGQLDAGGSTNGAEGINLAYKVATENFIKNGTNRVILATDGDFNVGISNDEELKQLIEKKAKTGVFLTTLGFGIGNLKDSKLEALADCGNGNYFYIDSDREANKVFIEQLPGTLITIAKDVKIQVEFNPLLVGSYRLIGYENRMLTAQDFKDDKKDAGEIGAGHTVTALYELIPPAVTGIAAVDPLKYQSVKQPKFDLTTKELMNVKIRYKAPDGEVSKEIVQAVENQERSYQKASPDFRFASAVASFGMMLRDSKFKGETDYKKIQALAEPCAKSDASGRRAEFLKLVHKASSLR